MIDLHAHILPHLDDGPQDINEALEMCRIAASDGIRAIVATPHAGNGTYRNHRKDIFAALEELRDQLRRKNISVQVLAGSDPYIRQDFYSLVEDGSITTVNDNHRYVMVEFPRDIIPPGYLNWLWKTRLRGLVPIFTHPERHPAVQKNTSLVAEWVDKGGLVQVTAMSITGHFGTEARNCAEKLMQQRLVHAIASDAHSAGGRPPILSAALALASDLVGFSYARQLVNDFPEVILSGKPFDVPEPVAPRKRRLSRIFDRRRPWRLGLFLFLIVSVFITYPSWAFETVRLPTIPMPSSGENDEGGGIARPTSPEGERSSGANPTVFQGQPEPDKGAGAATQNKDRINHKPVAERIDMKIGRKNLMTNPIRNNGRTEPEKELSADENASVPAAGLTWKEKKRVLNSK